MTAGTTVALSPDGRLLATDGKGIQLWDVASGKLKKTIKWAGQTIWAMTFDASGTRLLVSSNGQNDVIFDTTNGERLATLENTQRGQFSADGSVVIGGSSKHIVVWSTKDWKQVSEIPNGPDYVTRFAVHPGNDLVVVGGPNSARLVQLSSGKEIAKLGDGYTNFAAFAPSGSVIFTYPSSGFSLWDTAGKRYCTKPELGNGTVALSRDGRWLAAAPVGGGTTDVMVWDVNSILAGCAIPAQATQLSNDINKCA